MTFNTAKPFSSLKKVTRSIRPDKLSACCDGGWFCNPKILRGCAVLGKQAMYRAVINEIWQRLSDLAMKLLVGYRICPAVSVIGNKSVNRSNKRSRSRYAVVADTPSLEIESNPAGFTCCKTCSSDRLHTAIGGVFKARLRTGFFVGQCPIIQDTGSRISRRLTSRKAGRCCLGWCGHEWT